MHSLAVNEAPLRTCLFWGTFVYVPNMGSLLVLHWQILLETCSLCAFAQTLHCVDGTLLLPSPSILVCTAFLSGKAFRQQVKSSHYLIKNINNALQNSFLRGRSILVVYHFMDAHRLTQIKHSCYTKMPKLAQISKMEKYISTCEFLLVCRLLDLTLSQYLYMMLLFHDSRKYFLKNLFKTWIFLNFS